MHDVFVSLQITPLLNGTNEPADVIMVADEDDGIPSTQPVDDRVLKGYIQYLTNHNLCTNTAICVITLNTSINPP